MRRRTAGNPDMLDRGAVRTKRGVRSGAPLSSTSIACLPAVCVFGQDGIAGFAAEELQVDEIRTFTGNKKTPSWVFVTIEVWSRLWPSTVTGRRSYRNTHALFRDLSRRMNFGHLPLIVTDGFEFYQKVIRRFFGPALPVPKLGPLEMGIT